MNVSEIAHEMVKILSDKSLSDWDIENKIAILKERM